MATQYDYSRDENHASDILMWYNTRPEKRLNTDVFYLHRFVKNRTIILIGRGGSP